MNNNQIYAIAIHDSKGKYIKHKIYTKLLDIKKTLKNQYDITYTTKDIRTIIDCECALYKGKYKGDLC